MKLHKVHRLIALAFIANPDGKPCVDHINNNKLDNNISHLRWCSNQENLMNRSMNSRNSSGVKGVTFDERANKWNAQIMIDGICVYLGLFDTIEAATQERVNRV